MGIVISTLRAALGLGRAEAALHGLAGGRRDDQPAHQPNPAKLLLTEYRTCTLLHDLSPIVTHHPVHAALAAVAHAQLPITAGADHMHRSRVGL